MDTSKEYILMCEKAWEIQKAWKPEMGDWVRVQDDPKSEWRPPKKDSYTYVLYKVIGEQDPTFINLQITSIKEWIKEGRDYCSGYPIWLPRQDQLQNMIDWTSYSYPISAMVFQLEEFYRTLKELPNSMEQLWLAFVMKEKHNKTWDGKEWVKELK